MKAALQSQLFQQGFEVTLHEIVRVQPLSFCRQKERFVTLTPFHEQSQALRQSGRDAEHPGPAALVVRDVAPIAAPLNHDSHSRRG